MAFTRVQATAKASSFASSFNITFSGTPVVGNSIIIQIMTANGAGAYSGVTVSDNQANGGNLYLVSAPVTKCGIIFCPYIYAASGTFTISIAGLPFTTHVYNAVEIAGGGAAGIQIDHQVSGTGTSTAPATGTTGSFVSNNIYAASVHGIAAAQASITVGGSFTQEVEDLTNGGESDYQILTTAAGTTLSCSWTDASSAAWGAMLIGFAPAGAAGGGATASSAAYLG
jgi:hypothetical protein